MLSHWYDSAEIEILAESGNRTRVCRSQYAAVLKILDDLLLSVDCMEICWYTLSKFDSSAYSCCTYDAVSNLNKGVRLTAWKQVLTSTFCIQFWIYYINDIRFMLKEVSDCILNLLASDCTQDDLTDSVKYRWQFFLLLLLLLFLARQMETPVSSMKVAVHCRSSRLPCSLGAMGVWSGQIPFLSSL